MCLPLLSWFLCLLTLKAIKLICAIDQFYNNESGPQSLDIQSLAAKVFGLQKYTYNTKPRGGIWMSVGIVGWFPFR